MHAQVGGAALPKVFEFSLDTTLNQHPFSADSLPRPKDLVPYAELPPFVEQALAAALPVWRNGQSMPGRMRAQPLDPEISKVSSWDYGWSCKFFSSCTDKIWACQRAMQRHTAVSQCDTRAHMHCMYRPVLVRLAPLRQSFGRVPLAPQSMPGAAGNLPATCMRAVKPVCMYPVPWPAAAWRGLPHLCLRVPQASPMFLEHTYSAGSSKKTGASPWP